MDTGEIVKNIGISHPKLYYLEQKDYIGPKKISITGGEFRNYSEEEVKKIKLIWKHLKQSMCQDVWSLKLWREVLLEYLVQVREIGLVIYA